MKKYIFLTREGQTIAPNENIVIENMQVIGIVENVIDEESALKKLLQENTWIWDSGFNVGEFIVFEIK